MRQLREFNFDDDDIIEVYSDNQLIYSGKYVDIPEDLTLYAVQKKLRIYDVVVIDIQGSKMFNFIMSFGFIISLVMVFIATSSYLDKVSKNEMNEDDSHIFKFALTMFFLVMLANALWFGLLQEGI